MILEQRICTKCKIIKPFSEFNWDKRFNIPFSRCKECFNRKCKEYRISQAGKENYKKWEKSEKGRKVRKTAMAKWRSENEIKKKVQTAVHNAIRDGRLLRLPCSVCGEVKSEAHHPSYLFEDRFNVIWLCKKHHTEITFKN